jgi:hydroxymethylpyrimidine/phosphomethylpyrimidine kinase
VPVDFVAAQIDSVFSDVRVDALKIGMVHKADVAATIVDRLQRYEVANVVLDPVMVAKSGDRLLDDAAIAKIRDELLPLASIVTPNLPEAGVLLGREAPQTLDAMGDAVRALHELGPSYVLLKGGHLAGAACSDLLFNGKDVIELKADRIATKNTHGTGCTLSAAIAALLPRCQSVEDTVEKAKRYITGAIRESGRLNVGHGSGPVHHFHALWPEHVQERPTK